MLHPDRQVIPRGTTPTREVDPAVMLDIPDLYKRHVEMYQNLLARGATRGMCERYELEFYTEYGIIAWADGVLWEEWEGSVFREGDRWQICLGRYASLSGCECQNPEV